MWVQSIKSLPLALVLSCEGGRAQPSCEHAEALGVLEFKGEDGGVAMKAFCHDRSGGVASSLLVEGTSVAHLELPCICAIDSQLSIKENSELLDLTGLPNVSRIGGGLIISGNPKLQTLSGLPDIQAIGDYGGISIQIDRNGELSDLAGIPPRLTKLPGSIEIVQNERLLSLAGFPQGLTEAGGLAIRGNISLRDLAGLGSALTRLEGGLAISGNNRLRDLVGLPNALEWIDNEVSVFGNTSLEHLHGMPSHLRKIGTNLRITGNPALVDLSGLPAGLEIAWTLSISNNRELTDLSGLPDGLRIGMYERTGLSLLVQGNESLAGLSGLPKTLTSLPGTIVIRGTPLESLDGLFDHLTTIDGGLELHDNDDLLDLSGIPEGTVIGRDLAGPSLLIHQNDGLQSLSGLPTSMRALSGGLSIVDNKGLRDLTGLAVLESVAGDLLIGKLRKVNLADPCDWELAPGGNPDLETLAGLDALAFVGGTFAVACHPKLTSLKSLAALRSVANDLQLLHNPALSELDGLGGPTGSLDSIGGSFVVRCNAKLSQDMVEAVLLKVAEPVPTNILLDCG